MDRHSGTEGGVKPKLIDRIPCQLHSTFEIICISTKLPEEGSIFKCLNCVIEEDLIKQIIPLQHIMNSEDPSGDLSLASLTTNGKTALEEIKNALIKSESEIKTITQTVASSFKLIRSSILGKLTEFEEQMSKKIEELTTIQKRMKQELSQMSKRSAIQEIIENEKQSFEDKSERIKSLLSECKHIETSNISTLQQDLQMYSSTKESINFTRLSAIQSTILRIMSDENNAPQIDLPIERVESSKSSSKKSKISSEIKERLPTSIQRKLDSQYIIDLILRKRSISDDGLLLIKNILKTMDAYFSTFSVPDDAYVGELNKQQLKNLVKLEDFMRHFANQKKETYSLPLIPSNSEMIQKAIFNEIKCMGVDESWKNDIMKEISLIIQQYPIFEMIPRKILKPTELPLKFNKKEGAKSFNWSKGFLYTQGLQHELLHISIFEILNGQSIDLKGELFFCSSENTSKNYEEAKKSIILFSLSDEIKVPTGIQILRGNKITLKNIQEKVITKLEMRVCFRTKRVYIADFPNYENVNFVSELNFDPLKRYRLGVAFNRIGEIWSIEQTQLLSLADLSFIDNFIHP